MAHDLPDHKLSERPGHELEVPGHTSQRDVTEMHHKAPGPTSIYPSQSMDSKKDGLPPAVLLVLPPRTTDWMVRNTGAGATRRRFE